MRRIHLFTTLVSTEAPESWIYDTAYEKTLKRIKIRVLRTRSTPPFYLGGDYEGKLVRFVAGSLAREQMEKTAMIEFENGETRTGFLIKYLEPFTCASQGMHEGQEALVLDDPMGLQKHKGQVVTLREFPDGGKVTVSGKHETTMFEITTDRLAHLWPVKLQ